MSTYDKIRALPVCIEGISLEPLRHRVSDGFVRPTTVVRLSGKGHTGLGEDLIYEIDDQAVFARDGAGLPVLGTHTIDSFSKLLASTSLFSQPPRDPKAQRYRRWALESAALDLALRQVGEPLWRVLGRDLRPVSFVVSMGLGDPPSLRRVRELAAIAPSLRLKLDARSSWDEELMQAIPLPVSCIDLKGHYVGESIYQPPEELLYRRVFACFGDAWIEDAAFSETTRSLLDEHWTQLSWDAPIGSVEDIDKLPHRPAAINIKPSRFGSLHNLLAAYDYCAALGIVMYGGGEFELGPGRQQIQYLASLFHPDGANDVAPGVFNLDPFPATVSASPLEVRATASGFQIAG